MKMPIRKSYLFTVQGESVHLVDGRGVRQTYEAEYACGGHWRVYKYIPKPEIWMERGVCEAEGEIVLNLLHEFMEQWQMINKGFDYQTAHDNANKFEDEIREHYNFIGINTCSISGFIIAMLDLSEQKYDDAIVKEFQDLFGISINQYILNLALSTKA